jgi:O-antigen/teichoic acid export membrane protein
VPVIQVLALYFVFQAMGQVSQSLLRRRMDFRALQRSHIVSYLIAYVVLAIPLALAGWGAWSLVVAALAQVLIGGGLMYASAPHSLRPALRPKNSGYVSFGAKVMGTNVASQVMGTADAMVVGRVFGAVDLGVYTRTITLLFTSMMAVVSTLTSVLMPAYARGQDNVPGARRAYLASLSIVGLLCAPPLLTAAAVPETVILGLFGADWIAAVRLLGPLSFACLCAALTMVGGPLITGLGRPGTDMRVHLIAATFMVPTVILASVVSVAAVAWAAAAAFFVRFALMSYEALRVSGGRGREAVEALSGPLLVSAGTAGVIRVLDVLLVDVVPLAALRLPMEIAAGLVVATGLAWLCRPMLLTQNVRWLLGRIANRLPRAVVRHLGISG